MIRLIVLGLIAGAFFSATFILNELMSNAGGHWFWSASLRYVFMLLLLSLLIAGQHGSKRLIELAHIFRKYWGFWCVTGGIGFGLFYAGICFAADHASGWVVASTFMFTVVASLFVLRAFGQTFERQVIVYAVMIFIGVVLVNINEALHAATTAASPLVVNAALHDAHSPLLTTLIFGALPALVAAFSYPIGNQLVWQAAHNAHTKQRLQTPPQASSQTPPQTQALDNLSLASPIAQVPQTLPTTNAASWLARIPTIDTDLLNDAFNKVWLMTLGSLPFWLILGLLIHPAPPSSSQTFNTFLVALLSGVIATSVFLYARGQATTSKQVASVDATQASEVIFALLGGIILLGSALPSALGIFGIVLIILGLVLFARSG